MKPRVFIGSSVEAKDLCGAINLGLNHSAWCSPWYQIFPLSSGTLDALLEEFANSDFAVLVFAPNDVAVIRGAPYDVARDNVLFEAGLFMGMHGKKRTFIVTPQSMASFHVPTDLLGITTATYDPAQVAGVSAQSAMGAAVYAIEKAIQKVTKSQPDIHIASKCSHTPTATWKSKLNLKITNRQSVAVSIRSETFSFSKEAPTSHVDSVLKDGIHRPAFLIEHKAPPRVPEDRYAAECILLSGQTIVAWVDFDETLNGVQLEALRNQKKLGIWKYRCLWHYQQPIALNYEREF